MGCFQSTATTASAYCAQFPSSSDKDEPKDFVFVYNLPPTITTSKLEKKFQQFGKLTPGRIRIFNRGVRCNSYAYIEFERKSSARKAIEASYLMIRGQRVSIQESAPYSYSRD